MCAALGATKARVQSAATVGLLLPAGTSALWGVVVLVGGSVAPPKVPFLYGRGFGHDPGRLISLAVLWLRVLQTALCHTAP